MLLISVKRNQTDIRLEKNTAYICHPRLRLYLTSNTTSLPQPLSPSAMHIPDTLFAVGVAKIVPSEMKAQGEAATTVSPVLRPCFMVTPHRHGVRSGPVLTERVQKEILSDHHPDPGQPGSRSAGQPHARTGLELMSAFPQSSQL